MYNMTLFSTCPFRNTKELLVWTAYLQDCILDLVPLSMRTCTFEDLHLVFLLSFVWGILGHSACALIVVFVGHYLALRLCARFCKGPRGPARGMVNPMVEACSKLALVKVNNYLQQIYWAGARRASRSGLRGSRVRGRDGALPESANET